MIGKFSSLVGVGALAASLVAPSGAVAQTIEWDASGAIAHGSACTSRGPFPDTYFIAAGEDIAVIFSNMGIDLTPADAVNTAVHSCLIRIPIRVDDQVFLGELTQKVHWGYSKDYGTEGEIYANGTFFGRRTTPIRAYVGPGVQGIQSWITEEAHDLRNHWSGLFCRNRTLNGLLQVNLAVSARRNSASRDISVRIHGEDIRYEALAQWVHCP
jgi:hypothetical protein